MNLVILIVGTQCFFLAVMPCSYANNDACIIMRRKHCLGKILQSFDKDGVTDPQHMIETFHIWVMIGYDIHSMAYG